MKPSRSKALRSLSRKWAIPVVLELAHGVRRYGELERALRGVSQKMLAETLRHLEAGGLVTRTLYAHVPPTVEYELSPMGLEVLESIRALWTVVQRPSEPPRIEALA